MSLFFFGDPILMIFSYIIFAVLMFIAMGIMEKSEKDVLSLSIKHAIYPAIGFVLGGFIDVIIYSDSIGGIQGGTPYTFALMLSFPVMYIIGFLILLSIGYFSRRVSLSDWLCLFCCRSKKDHVFTCGLFHCLYFCYS